MRRNLFPLLALTLIASASCHAGDDLGRLFYSPQQRAEMDRQTCCRPSEKNASTLRLDGLIRHGRHRTYWLNGQAQALPPSDTPPLRVGETTNLDTGERYDRLENGVVRVHRHVRP